MKNILIIRNILDCYLQRSQQKFAPMIDPVTHIITKDYNAIKLTTYGSKVKLPKNNFLDTMFKALALIEKALRKLIRLNRDTTFIECLYWNMLFKIRTPYKIFCIEPTQSMLKVCNLKKIKVCEVQHGVIGTHIVKENKYFADNFLTWDRRSSENILIKTQKKVDPITSVNMLYYQHLLDKKYKGSNKIQISDKKNILISLQWGLVSTHKYDAIKLEKSFLPLSFINFCKKNMKNYNFIFKLHPMSIKKREAEVIFEDLKRHNLVNNFDDFLLSANQSVYEALNLADIHVTLYSSIVIEASNLNIPSIILDPHCNKGGPRENYFKKEVEEGIAIVSNDDDIESHVLTLLSKKYDNYKDFEVIESILEQSIYKFLDLH
ncbi:MAG: hypothetical protein CBE49_000355 [Rickettsiales bacterium TMED289]|nr:MAG: hypothetical protein CBE49_000355 [Rickettsiales bacterium TMED289]